MPLSNDQAIKKLFENPIDGVDYDDALNRFGNQVAIYLRILKVFISNSPQLLNKLAAATPETIEDYTINVHGFKGSCYSISAIALGDEAKALEFASRDLDWKTVEAHNPLLIRKAYLLIYKLQKLVDKIESL